LLFASALINAETSEASTAPVIRIRPPAANSTSITPAAEAATAAGNACRSGVIANRRKADPLIRPRLLLNCANQKPRPRSPAPRMQEIRMDIMAARDLGDVRLRRQRLLDQPQLLSLSPPPSPLRAR
jgi:hypothetical protein